jgi:hypothetical protein
MSLKDKASLIFKPSRYKSGKVYSYRGEDFTFTRSSVATRINSEGNLEEVASGVPRLNYDGTDLTKCPNLLLEPSRANLALDSNDFGSSFWLNVNSSIVSNSAISPEGVLNADKLVEDSSDGTHYVRTGFMTTTDGSTLTTSLFVKAAERTQIRLQENAYNAHIVKADLITQSVTTTGIDAGIEPLKNGWFRIYIIDDARPSTRWQIRLVKDDNTSYQGDGTSGIYIYGFQTENQSSYPTSLIKTNGSSATRNADKVDGQVNASSYNDDEGVLYVDFSALSATRDNEFRFLISDGTNNERIQIGLQTSGNLYASVITGNSSTASFNYTLPNPTQNHKIALKYKANDCALWVDGVKRGTDTSAAMPSGLDEFDFYRTPNNNNYVEANVKEVLYFKQALSDSQLLSLTSYDDYQELVDRNDLTWESPTITNNRLTALKEL